MVPVVQLILIYNHMGGILTEYNFLNFNKGMNYSWLLSIDWWRHSYQILIGNYYPYLYRGMGSLQMLHCVSKFTTKTNSRVYLLCSIPSPHNYVCFLVQAELLHECRCALILKLYFIWTYMYMLFNSMWML